jgi:hypothetical protein
MPKFSKIIFALALLLPAAAAAQNDPVKVPDEVKPFVAKDMIPIALETGDLNGDGRKDAILVLSKPTRSDGTFDEAGMDDRQTLILARDASGKLTLAARNDHVTYCHSCGGVMGDPFAGLTIKGTTFTIDNYGGSNDRWAVEFSFAYSKRDNNWQLVRVEETNFVATDPNHTTRKHVYTPPKNFGLINFADLDPENFKGKGAK